MDVDVCLVLGVDRSSRFLNSVIKSVERLNRFHRLVHRQRAGPLLYHSTSMLALTTMNAPERPTLPPLHTLGLPFPRPIRGSASTGR
jgi:hypothetical protein